MLASELSKRREIADASHAFAKVKENANGALPSYVVTDCLQTYKRAFIKEFNDRAVMHIKTKSLSEGFQNRPVERYHNEMRSVIKARRGLGNDKSAQKFVDGYRHYHNFVRPHTGLPDNQTPAEAAGIDLKLDKQNPMKDLIVKSAIASQKETNFEGQVCFITTFEVYFDEFRRLFPKIHVSCFVHQPLTLSQLAKVVREELAQPQSEEDEPIVRQPKLK